MAVSNPATFSSIKAEFGGSTNFKDYYRGGPYVPSSASSTISTTAAGLSMSQFNGVSAFSIALSASAVSQVTNPKTLVTTYSGSATATPAGGTSPYTYSWTKVSGTTLTSFTNTTAATCSWSFRDDAGVGGGSIVLQCVCTEAGGAQSTKQITISW